MKPFSLLTALGLSLCAVVGANAQDRDLHSERLVLDNDAGNTATIQTPTLTQPTTTLTIPDPGAGAASFLLTESASPLTVGSNMNFTGTLDFTGATIIGGGGTPQVNATLIGDGSVGTPLGINLANANTWTGQQTWNGAFNTFNGLFLVTANSRIALTNSDNNPRDVRWQEPSGTGTQYIGIRAPSVTNNGNYVWPAVVGSVGQVMRINTSNGIDSATMSWGTITGGAILFTRVGVTATAGNTSYNVVAADDIVGVNMSAGTNFTVNLPPATTAGEILIVKIEAYNNALLPVLTIQPGGGNTVDGAANLAFGNANGVRRLYSSGTGQWFTW